MWYLNWIATFIIGGITAWQVLKYLFPYLPYDMKLMKLVINSYKELDAHAKANFTQMDQLIQRAKERPNKPFLKFSDETWTYEDVNNYASKTGRALNGEGIKNNDTIAIMMTSQPLFVTTWFGIGKAGGVSSFINHNLRKKPLLHCINICNAKHLIVSNDDFILDAVEEVWEELKAERIKIYLLGFSKHEVAKKLTSLSPLIDSASSTETPFPWRSGKNTRDGFCLIYTSGTTGVPKAACINFRRGFAGSNIIPSVKAYEDDIVYCPLPLYHSAGSLIGVLGTLKMGATIVLRKKFSATCFWDDCRKYNATVIQYIGETMHYICNQPEKSNDRDHKVRLAVGNGLRPNIWKEFCRRFGDVKIGEFYAATEGVTAFLNIDYRFGSVGRMTPLIRFISKTVFAKYDHEKQEPVRDNSGRVVRAALGEPGLLLSQINARQTYEGYYNQKKLSDKKILRNVVKKGDSYFNTGDIMMRDKNYYVSFVDRVGDTYRWKGENVSTNEVAGIMGECEGLEQVNVYGVEVPDREGRRGMAAVSIKEGYKFDGKSMYKVACENLASYARPVFLRIVTEHQLTGNFKLKKTELVSQGFDPEKTSGDPVFIIDHKERSYKPLTSQLISEILNGAIKI